MAEFRELTREQCMEVNGTYYLPDGPCAVLPEYLAEADRVLVDDLAQMTPSQKIAAGLSYTGLSPDAPITANEQGGKQSVVEGRFDLLPPVAMFELAKVMEHGAQKYAPNNWRKIEVESHVNHALMHLFAWLAGDRQEHHLTHALARSAMAVELDTLEGHDED